jgi:hypothetical protein
MANPSVITSARRMALTRDRRRLASPTADLKRFQPQKFGVQMA